MKCEVCGHETDDIKIRENPFSPYFVGGYMCCDSCWETKEVPYYEMIKAISQYEDFTKIPHTLKEKTVKTVLNRLVTEEEIDNFFIFIQDLFTQRSIIDADN